MSASNAAIAQAANSLDLDSRIDHVVETAACHADAVDREARFPKEAFAAAKAHRLLGMMVPSDLGGEGVKISEVADICYRLGRGCGSTALILRDASGQTCLPARSPADQCMAA
jgi:acyl-CoA dehydrogenase